MLATYGYGDTYYPSYGGDYPYDGGYDMGGVYRDDLGYEGYADPYTRGYGGSGYDNYDGIYDGFMADGLYDDVYRDTYDNSAYGAYYPDEDSYYGALGDLLEYEDQLMALDISEDERLARWQERQAFDELEDAERSLRWQQMDDGMRYRLGLTGQSYWASRYGYGRPISGGWRRRYGDRVNRALTYGMGRLPLSRNLRGRYGRLVGRGNLRGLESRLEYARERANQVALQESERMRLQLETERLEREIDRRRRMQLVEEQRLRTDLQQEELIREQQLRDQEWRRQELAEDVRQLNEEERLRRQIDRIGAGLY